MQDFPNIYVKKMGCGRIVLLCMWESWNKISILNWKKAQDISNSCKSGYLCLLGKDTCCELRHQSSSAWHSRTQYSCQNSILGKREEEKQEETRRDRGKVLPLLNTAITEKLESQIIVITFLGELELALYGVEARLMIPPFCMKENSLCSKLLSFKPCVPYPWFCHVPAELCDMLMSVSMC